LVLLSNHFIYDVLFGGMIYFLLANGTYFVLMCAGIRDIRTRRKSAQKQLENGAPKRPVSIVAPAYNMEHSILKSVAGLLRLEYADYEIILVNDGSSDRTLRLLMETYDLVEEAQPDGVKLLCRGQIRGLYRSRKNPNLRVLDKENRGNKADALNAGISFVRHELFCAVDADSLLERDALDRIMEPFHRDFEKVSAAGGTIRVLNGSAFRDGAVREAKVSIEPLVLFQIIEYLRAFYTGRTGWNWFNSFIVISGAFGVFKTSDVQAVGGYSDSAIGEDMELVMRLHRYHRRLNHRYAIEFVPEAVCWTVVPANIHSLYVQRNRWQRGLFDSLIQNRGMLFNPRYGGIGFFAIPYFIFVELLGPILEVFIWGFIFVAQRRGMLSSTFFWELIWISLGLSWIFSICSILVERRYFARYVSKSNYFKLLIGTIFEPFGYGQLTAVWRFAGFLDFIRGNRSWGKMKRRGFDADIKME
jgi:cellulose synthase/poly-beta-1,6-N-acetylglucosamine synthase-like glycosyltransferase